MYPILAYSFYFWLSIVRDLPTRFNPTPCGTSYFLFARIDSHNFKEASTAILVFDGYMMAAVAIGLLAFLGTLVYFLLEAVYRKIFPRNRRTNNTQSHSTSSITMNHQNRRRSNSIQNPQRVDSVNLWGQNPWNVGQLIKRIVETYPHLVAAAFNFIILIWTILAVELPIHWNHISDVYSLQSTGQFIPLITGIANLIIITYKFMKPLEDGIYMLIVIIEIRLTQVIDDKPTEEEPHELEDLSHQNGQPPTETQEPLVESLNEETQPAERQPQQLIEATNQDHLAERQPQLVEAANQDHPAERQPQQLVEAANQDHLAAASTGRDMPAQPRKRHTK
jgi:hypothetical protein